MNTCALNDKGTLLFLTKKKISPTAISHVKEPTSKRGREHHMSRLQQLMNSSKI